MAAHYNPKILAKTLSYIAFHSPGEYGLFWDSNGTMPWKEFHWALQEDETLRFVRESHLKEIAYLGIDMPVVLDGAMLRLKDNAAAPPYYEETPPERCYYACRRKRYASIKEDGLSASNRAFFPVSTNKDLAIRIAKRRDPDPLLIEIRARKASEMGVKFLKAGPELYLVEFIATEFLMLPVLRDDELSKLSEPKKKEKTESKAKVPYSPGSFLMDPKRLEGAPQDKSASEKKKGRRGAEWKREARKERHKRNV